MIKKKVYHYIALYINKSIEEQFICMMTVCCSTACILAGFTDILLGLTSCLTIYVFLFGALCFVFFYQSFFRNRTSLIKYPFIIGVLGIIVASWIVNQGIEGSTPAIFTSAIIVGAYLVNRRHVLYAYIFLIVLLLSLFYIQFYQPQIILSYPSHDLLLRDLAISLSIGSATIGLVIIILKKVDERERVMIDVQNRALVDKNIALKMQFDINKQQNIEISNSFEAIKQQKQYIATQNIQLEIANRDLMDLNATKDKFISLMGHDLKNPIAAIVSLSELLERNIDVYDYDKIEQITQTIATSSKRACDLLDNLLIWARCQTRNIQYKPSFVCIDQIAEKNIELMMEYANQKNVSVSCQAKKDILVYCDANMISAVIRNLLTNSIKFTPSGGEISININETDEIVVIDVSDTGVGMYAEQINKLFKLGEHVSSAGTNKEPGTGLGLLICRDFLAMHNSSLTVESTKNIGSSFSFTLSRCAPSLFSNDIVL